MEDLYSVTPTDQVLQDYFNTPGYALLFGNNNQLDPRERFQASPGYQFQMDEGMKQLQRNAAAKGLLESGPMLQELTKYGQGLANQEYNNWANQQNSLFNNYQNQLMGLTNLGSQFSGAPEAYNIGNQNSQLAYGTGQNLALLGQNYGQNTASLYNNLGTQYSNLFMNTAAAKAQNYGNNYAMNVQLANNQQASNMGNSLFSGMRF